MTLTAPRWKAGLRATITLLLACLSNSLLAQTTPPEAPGVSNGALLQMLFGLILIIGVLFAGAYLLRKLNGGQAFGQKGPIKLVGGLMISTRERILLVEIENTWLVVGVVPGQIKTLHTLPKGESPADTGMEKPFGHWLKQITERNHEQK